jgi:uncharacterized protein YqeY
MTELPEELSAELDEEAKILEEFGPDEDHDREFAKEVERQMRESPELFK